MKRLIGVLMALPSLTFCQTWANQDVIPLNRNAYSKTKSTQIGQTDIPASLGFQRNVELGLAIENKYSIKELTTLSLGFGIPLQNGYIGLNTSLQGNTLFSNYSGNLSYGILINKQTTLGIGSGIQFQNIKGYGSEKNIQVSAGIAHLINEKTMFAFHYQLNQNIGPSSFANKPKTEGLTLGIGYHLSKSVFIQLEAKKLQQQFRILPNINWSPFEKIGFWCGTNGSGNLHLGIISALKKSKAMLGFSNHPHLGYSMLLQFNYRIDDKN
ncbi:MAG: hypothetical protein RL000_457 [Bacteroidota bacterium]|jgi:hypothetical protein